MVVVGTSVVPAPAGGRSVRHLEVVEAVVDLGGACEVFAIVSPDPAPAHADAALRDRVLDVERIALLSRVEKKQRTEVVRELDIRVFELGGRDRSRNDVRLQI